MIKSILFILMTVVVIKTENVPIAPESKTAINSDAASSSSIEESQNRSTESRSMPDYDSSIDSAVDRSGEQGSKDLSIESSQFDEQVRFMDQPMMKAAISPKFRRSDHEVNKDVSVNDDQKSDEVNSAKIDDNSKIIDENEPVSGENKEEFLKDDMEKDIGGIDQPPERIDADNSPEILSGRRMIQQDVVLDTKGRSGHGFISENIESMRAFPPIDFRGVDMLRPLDVRPAYKNDFVIPQFPTMPRPGMFFNPSFGPNPQTFFNQIGSMEALHSNLRRFTSGYPNSKLQSQPDLKSSDEFNAVDVGSNTYPYVPPLTSQIGQFLPTNNMDVFRKISEVTEFPKPQLQFSGERRGSFQRSFNLNGVPGFHQQEYHQVF